MRDEPATPKRTTGGLASCDECLDVFPASRLVPAGSRAICVDCNRRIAARVDAAAPAGRPARAPDVYVSREAVAREAVARDVAGGARAPSGPQATAPGGFRSGGPSHGVAAAAAPEAEPARNDNPYAEPPMRSIRPRAVDVRHAAPDVEGGPVRAACSPFERTATPRAAESGGNGAAVESASSASPASSVPSGRIVASRFGGGFGGGNAMFMGSGAATSPPPIAPASQPSSQPMTSSPAAAPSLPGAPSARRPIAGFPHLSDASPSPAPARSAERTFERSAERNTDTPPSPGTAPAPDAAPASRATGAAAGKDGFGEYAELRGRIDAGDDSFETRRRAGELASRLSLQIEAVEHYKRCVELAPGDDRMRGIYENVRRSVGVERGGAAEPASEPVRRVADEAVPFWRELGDVMAYPLAGRGASVLVAGGIFFAVADVLRSVNPFGWALSIMIAGYCACYLFDVINATGAGKRALPEMPEFTSFLETYVVPLWSLVVCGAISFAPFVVTLWLSFAGVLPAPASTVACILAFAWGAFAMPMTLMIRAMFQNWTEPLDPSLILGSIGRILPDYVAAYIAMSVLWVAYTFASVVLFGVCWLTLGLPTADAILAFDAVRILSWLLFTLLSWPLFLYTWTLQGHILGRTYRQGLRRLQWFVKGTPESRVAQRTSAALVIGALAASVLLCAAAWGVSKAAGAMGAGGASALLTKSPLKDGSRLTYFWQHTDGAAGLTTYSFDARPDGLLRVTAAVRLAQRPDQLCPPEELGVMDPATGVFVSAGQAWGAGVSYEGRRGEHVAFFGPARAAIGSTYLNEWPVRSTDRWQDTWQTWRVQFTDPARPSADLFYDTRSGILVGRKYGGMGFLITEWLVAARGVAGATLGPPPEYDFGPQPLDWLGEGASSGAGDGAGDGGGEPFRPDAR